MALVLQCWHTHRYRSDDLPTPATTANNKHNNIINNNNKKKFKKRKNNNNKHIIYNATRSLLCFSYFVLRNSKDPWGVGWHFVHCQYLQRGAKPSLALLATGCGGETENCNIGHSPGVKQLGIGLSLWPCLGHALLVLVSYSHTLGLGCYKLGVQF